MYVPPILQLPTYILCSISVELYARGFALSIYINYIVDLLPKGRAELVPSLIVTYERYESRLNKQPILRHMYNRLDTLQKVGCT